MGRSEADHKVRLFCGVPVSMETVRSLTDAASAMRERALAAGLKVKWVAPAGYHITLKFLGWSRPEAVEAVRDRVERELRGAGAFRFAVRGTGAFPKPERARVLWAGVSDPDGRIADLAARIDRAAEELGYEPERRAFHPHVTLARIRAPGDASEILAAGDGEHGETDVSAVVLYESVLKPKGSEYLERVRWSLGSGRIRPDR